MASSQLPSSSFQGGHLNALSDVSSRRTHLESAASGQSGATALGGGRRRQPQQGRWGCREKRGSHEGRDIKQKGSDETQEVNRLFNPDLGSVFKSGSKKQNLNHLLNFNFEPRGRHQGGQHGEGRQREARGKRGGNGKSGGSKEKAFSFNKEQYLQANCQFVVRSVSRGNGGLYANHLIEPDLLVDWNLIEEVKLKTASVSSCPICLDKPIAAKITKCGHIYCHPCILHYLALSDHAWRKCPICYDSIYKRDLKSVVSLPYSELRVGDSVDMQLMRRDKSSLLAVPVEQSVDWDDNKKFVMMTDGSITNYSKLVLASSVDVVKYIISRERVELERKFRDEGGEPEGCFIEESLHLLEERERQLLEGKKFKLKLESQINEERTIQSKTPITENEVTTVPQEVIADQSDCVSNEEVVAEKGYEQLLGEEGIRRSYCQGARPRCGSSSSDGSLEIEIVEEEEVTSEDLDLSSLQINKSSEKDYYYFYQASDGQPLFLHAVNVKMLVDTFGSFEQCPLRIRGKILEKDNTTMREELRSKLKYLRHLPLASVFEVCEIDFEVPTIAASTQDKFRDWLELRHKKRNQRERIERRREKRIRLEEERKMGKLTQAKVVSLDSTEHFPDMTSAAAFPSFNSSHELSINEYENEGGVDNEKNGDGKCSFAAMLRVGQPRTMMHKSRTFPAALDNDDHEHDSASGCLPAPPKASIGDALALAMEKAALNNSKTQKEGKGRKKGKKNKGTKIDLTAMTRPTL